MRWLLSNILLIVIVLVLSYVYVYWDKLADEDTPAGPAIAWLSGEFKFVGDLVTRLDSFSEQKVAAMANGSKTADVEEAEQLVEVSVPAVQAPAIEVPAAEDKFVTPEIVRSLTQLTGGLEPSVTAEALEVPASADIPKTAITADAESTSTRELWIAARRFFHRRDYENSIKNYERLIAITQDNYDAHGELGNVYFNQGRIKQAAASYYEAAVVLVRLGQVERAASLVGLLGRMDTEKASELQELITSAQS